MGGLAAGCMWVCTCVVCMGRGGRSGTYAPAVAECACMEGGPVVLACHTLNGGAVARYLFNKPSGLQCLQMHAVGALSTGTGTAATCLHFASVTPSKQMPAALCAPPIAPTCSFTPPPPHTHTHCLSRPCSLPPTLPPPTPCGPATPHPPTPHTPPHLPTPPHSKPPSCPRRRHPWPTCRPACPAGSTCPCRTLTWSAAWATAALHPCSWPATGRQAGSMPSSS